MGDHADKLSGFVTFLDLLKLWKPPKCDGNISLKSYNVVKEDVIKFWGLPKLKKCFKVPTKYVSVKGIGGRAIWESVVCPCRTHTHTNIHACIHKLSVRNVSETNYKFTSIVWLCCLTSQHDGVGSDDAMAMTTQSTIIPNTMTIFLPNIVDSRCNNKLFIN